MNQTARQADKMNGAKEARKGMVKKAGKLLKDQAKKDAKVVKEKL